MKVLTVLGLASLFAAGCTSMSQTAMSDTATAELKNAAGQSVGNATFTQLQDGVRIVLTMRGMPPGAKGAHIHGVGKCEPPAFISAGGHFNPEKKQHGLQNPSGPHAGDLPNITINADGTGRLETTTSRIMLGAGSHSIFGANGSALVVHASADDFKTDPTGNSGARLACGVIAKTGAR